MALKVVDDKCSVDTGRNMVKVVLESDAEPEQAIEELSSMDAYHMAIKHARSLGVNATAQYGLPNGPYPVTPVGVPVETLCDEHGNFQGFPSSVAFRYRIDITVRGA